MNDSISKQAIRRIGFLFFEGVVLLFTLTAAAQKPIERKGSAYVKISLQAYAFSKLLNDNAKGRGAGMSLE